MTGTEPETPYRNYRRSRRKLANNVLMSAAIGVLMYAVLVFLSHPRLDSQSVATREHLQQLFLHTHPSLVSSLADPGTNLALLGVAVTLFVAAALGNTKAEALATFDKFHINSSLSNVYALCSLYTSTAFASCMFELAINGPTGDRASPATAFLLLLIIFSYSVMLQTTGIIGSSTEALLLLRTYEKADLHSKATAAHAAARAGGRRPRLSRLLGLLALELAIGLLALLATAAANQAQLFDEARLVAVTWAFTAVTIGLVLAQFGRATLDRVNILLLSFALVILTFSLVLVSATKTSVWPIQAAMVLLMAGIAVGFCRVTGIHHLLSARAFTQRKEQLASSIARLKENRRSLLTRRRSQAKRSRTPTARPSRRRQTRRRHRVNSQPSATEF